MRWEQVESHYQQGAAEICLLENPTDWGASLPFLLPWKVLLCALLLSFCPICHLRTDSHLHPGGVWSPRLSGPLGTVVTWADASPAVWLRSRRLGRPCCVGVDVSLILGSRSDKEGGGPHFSLEVPGHAAAGLILCDNNDSIFHNPPLLPRFDLTSHTFSDGLTDRGWLGPGWNNPSGFFLLFHSWIWVKVGRKKKKVLTKTWIAKVKQQNHQHKTHIQHFPLD